MKKYKIYNSFSNKEEIITTRFTKRELALIRYAVELAQSDRPDSVESEMDIINTKLDLRIKDDNYVSKVFTEID